MKLTLAALALCMTGFNVHADQAGPPRPTGAPPGYIDHGFEPGWGERGPAPYPPGGCTRPYGCRTRVHPFDPSYEYACVDARFCEPPQLPDPGPEMAPTYGAPELDPRGYNSRRYGSPFQRMALTDCRVSTNPETETAGPIFETTFEPTFEPTFELKDGYDRVWYRGTRANADAMKIYYESHAELQICPKSEVNLPPVGV